jgi:3-oxoacyl-[acyl-carrier protein] reductase
VETLGGLDILVNNAAITHFIDFSALEDVTDEVWESIVGTNVYGAFYMTRAAAPHLQKDGDAVVVNVGSLSGIGDTGSSIPYCASKAAIHNLTKTFARALSPSVRVNCVAPGGINTEWADKVSPVNSREE